MDESSQVPLDMSSEHANESQSFTSQRSASISFPTTPLRLTLNRNSVTPSSSSASNSSMIDSERYPVTHPRDSKYSKNKKPPPPQIPRERSSLLAVSPRLLSLPVASSPLPLIGGDRPDPAIIPKYVRVLFPLPYETSRLHLNPSYYVDLKTNTNGTDGTPENGRRLSLSNAEFIHKCSLQDEHLDLLHVAFRIHSDLTASTSLTGHCTVALKKEQFVNNEQIEIFKELTRNGIPVENIKARIVLQLRMFYQ